MTDDDEFIIIVSEKRFVLTGSQLQFDAPNYFTKRFSRNPPEDRPQIIELSRDPNLFRLIVDYLCGYSVISLDPPKVSNLPKSRTVQDLLRDATFYQFDKLKTTCEKVLAAAAEQPSESNSNSEPPVENFLILTGHGAGQNTANKLWDARKNYVATRVREEKLSDWPFQKLTTPESCKGFDGIQELGLVRMVKNEVLGKNADIWEIVGWNSHTQNRVVIVLRKS